MSEWKYNKIVKVKGQTFVYAPNFVDFSFVTHPAVRSAFLGPIIGFTEDQKETIKEEWKKTDSGRIIKL